MDGLVVLGCYLLVTYKLHSNICIAGDYKQQHHDHKQLPHTHP
jgi:hypothetical protein